MSIKRIIQAQMLQYLICSGEKKYKKRYDKISLLKLVFFADRFHLRKYSKSISQDKYVAMQRGPVPLGVKELLENNSSYKGNTDPLFIREQDRLFRSNNENVDFNMLSETNVEALDFSLNHFGCLEQEELVEKTHQYPEWKRFEKKISNEQDLQDLQYPINENDFFSKSIGDEDPYNCIPANRVDLSKQFYFGLFWLEIPLQIAVESIRDSYVHKKIFLYREKKHSPSSPPHYHLAFEINEEQYLIIVFITSQVEKKKKYTTKGIVEVNHSDFDCLTKPSCIDCNIVDFVTKDELKQDIDGEIKIISISSFNESLRERIFRAIIESPSVNPYVKDMLQRKLE